MQESNQLARPIGVIGLGLLGTALWERLINGGFPTVIYNRTREKAEPLIHRGAKWSDNPLLECDRAVICLYTTETVEQVLDQFSAALRDGQILIDTTTGDPEQTARLGEKLAKRGVHYLESPIAASSQQTRDGEAMAIVAGSHAAFHACEDLLRCLSPKCHYVGHWGNAAKMKLVNNLVLGLHRAILAEGLLFAKAVGIEMPRALEVLKDGNAYSKVMDVKGQKMVDGDFSVQARLTQHTKDIRIVLETANRHDRSMPLTALHLDLLERAEQDGLGDLDNSAIIRAMEALQREG